MQHNGRKKGFIEYNTIVLSSAHLKAGRMSTMKYSIPTTNSMFESGFHGNDANLRRGRKNAQIPINVLFSFFQRKDRATD